MSKRIGPVIVELDTATTCVVYHYLPPQGYYIPLLPTILHCYPQPYDTAYTLAKSMKKAMVSTVYSTHTLEKLRCNCSGKRAVIAWGFFSFISLLFLNVHADSFEKFGDIGQFLIPAAITTVSGIKSDTSGLMQAGVSYATTMAITHSLKYGIGDRGIGERPSGKGDGFPSDHTAAAFMGGMASSVSVWI